MDAQDQTVSCPRCGVGRYMPYGVTLTDDDQEAMKSGELPAYPALSRVFDTYICSPCGTDEAMRDFSGAGPLGLDQWDRHPEPIERDKGDR